MDCFTYHDNALNHLKKRDKRLGQAIDDIGLLQREVNPDLFSALVHSIVGQQISSKAHTTVWLRMKEMLGEVTPAAVAAGPPSELQRCGITFKKVDYIQGAAQKVLNGSLDIHALHAMDDAEVCRALVQLPGIGVWTAEMLMLFSMQRSDILSYGDLAILRGMRMLYHHKSIPRPLFEKYRKRYSPYGSVASLYLWAISANAIAGMKDYAPKKGKAKE